MKWTSVLAIYFLIFCFTAFLLLPFGVKTHEEVGVERVPGQADSAPHKFDLPRHLLQGGGGRGAADGHLRRQLRVRLG